jgi:hypothetical protein
MTLEFIHESVQAVHWQTVRPRDSRPKIILRIVSRIPLNPLHPRYNAERHRELERAAASYSRSLGEPFEAIEFEESAFLEVCAGH